MAEKTFDVKNVLKNKYKSLTKNASYPFKVLMADDDDLMNLLLLYSNDELKTIINHLDINIKKNKKIDLADAVYEKTVEDFEGFLLLSDSRMYELLSGFKSGSRKNIKEFGSSFEYISFLLERGYLFRCLDQDSEMLVIPKQLIEILADLDELSLYKAVRKNDKVFKIAENLLYYFGVIQESEMYFFLNNLIYNLDNGKENVKLDFSNLNPSEYYENKEIYGKWNREFNQYVKYCSKIDEVHFNDNFYSVYYSYHQVFDPYNIDYEQKIRKDLDYLMLSPNDLLGVHFDNRPKKIMSDYLVSNLNLGKLSANRLIDEWCCYIKNGENPNYYLNIIIESIEWKSTSKVNELLNFSNKFFTNKINQWQIKGHTPYELSGIKVDDEGLLRFMDRKQVETIPAHAVAVKSLKNAVAGRNEMEN